MEGAELDNVTALKLVALPVPLGLVPAVVTVPPLKAMVGAEVKLLPGLVIVTPVTVPEVPLLKIAVAVAPAPPPPEIVTIGGAE